MAAGLFSKFHKAIKLAQKPRFITAVLRQRTAASVEHLDAIRLTEARTLVDVGANKGQFSLAFRALRPHATIEAFEPLPRAAASYHRLFGSDSNVRLHHVAASDTAGEAAFFVTDREDSSSLFSPGEGQAEAFGVRKKAQVKVETGRIDAYVDKSHFKKPILLKIDVQGAELKVIAGCGDLEWVDFIYVELSFEELYEGQPLFHEVYDYIVRRGFDLIGIYNQVQTERFGPTQVDCLFRNKAREAAS